MEEGGWMEVEGRGRLLRSRVRRKEEEEEDGTKLAAADGHPPLYIPPHAHHPLCILHSAFLHTSPPPSLASWTRTSTRCCLVGLAIALCCVIIIVIITFIAHLSSLICIICPVRVRISCPRAPRATAHTFVLQTPGVLR